MHLAGEHDVVAAALECLADDLLGFAPGVHVGGVDEVDPCVQGPVDDPDRVVVVGVSHGPKHHGAQAVGADLDSGPAQRAVLHSSLPFGEWPAPCRCPAPAADGAGQTQRLVALLTVGLRHGATAPTANPGYRLRRPDTTSRYRVAPAGAGGRRAA